MVLIEPELVDVDEVVEEREDLPAARNLVDGSDDIVFKEEDDDLDKDDGDSVVVLINKAQDAEVAGIEFVTRIASEAEDGTAAG